MTMIGVDEGEAEFSAGGDLADVIRFAARVNVDGGDKAGDELGNLEADGLRRVDAATGVGVDGFHGDAAAGRGRRGSMLAVDGGGNDRGGETGQRPDLNDPARSEDADERGEKKIIARADSTGMADIVPVDHGMKEIELARSGNFSRMAELSGELPIFDLELFEGLELADVEASPIAGGRDLLAHAANFPRKTEAPAWRRKPKQIEITREGQFQAANFAALRAQTNVC